MGTDARLRRASTTVSDVEVPPMAQRLLITGGAGKVATLLRPRLATAGRTLRLLDIVAPAPVEGSGAEEVVLASLDDPEAVAEACAGVDAILHLGGQSKESDAEDVLRRNAYGTYCLLEGAR